MCIMSWVCHRYYKKKVIYEDIFSVPIIQNSKIIQNDCFFFVKKYKCTKFPVRGRFRFRFVVGR